MGQEGVEKAVFELQEGVEGVEEAIVEGQEGVEGAIVEGQESVERAVVEYVPRSQFNAPKFKIWRTHQWPITVYTNLEILQPLGNETQILGNLPVLLPGDLSTSR